MEELIIVLLLIIISVLSLVMIMMYMNLKEYKLLYTHYKEAYDSALIDLKLIVTKRKK